MSEFDITIDYRGLADEIYREKPEEYSIEAYFLDLRANAPHFTELGDKTKLFGDIDVKKRLEPEGKSFNISMENLSRYVEIERPENEVFERIHSNLGPDLSYRWQLTYQNESSNLLEVVEGLETDTKCRIRMTENNTAVDLVYNPRHEVFKVNPARSEKDTEIDHELFEKACEVVQASEFDAFSD